MPAFLGDESSASTGQPVSPWCWAASQMEQAGSGPECDEPSAGPQPPVPGQELPIPQELESLPMLG